ncbi:uncharacterized protein VP01_2774g1 [Puccinia sorghi]|uniref:Uncharacterized protein n=1 Tax=Puccinia sorghi TaxID=27349 RepID=A0A0L6V2T8_9BASI|nr:uncharacterized protein VP01_2774g1 [Puccinia sorghi]
MGFNFVLQSVFDYFRVLGVEAGDNPPVWKPLASPRGGYRIITVLLVGCVRRRMLLMLTSSSRVRRRQLGYKTLLRLMDNEVKFALKKAMQEPAPDLSTLTNIIEDLCNKTRLGIRQSVARQAAPEIGLSEVMVRTKDIPQEDAQRRLKITILFGHLDSGTVRSVLGKNYLGFFCPPWENFILPIELGSFHSASGALVPLNIKLQLREIHMVIHFVVMENVSSRYFIIGNDYLVHYKISFLNNEQRQFTFFSTKLLMWLILGKPLVPLQMKWLTMLRSQMDCLMMKVVD